MTNDPIRQVTLQDTTVACEVTGEHVVQGACPTHGGDNCLRSTGSPLQAEAVEDIGRLALHTKVIELARERDELRAELGAIIGFMTDNALMTCGEAAEWISNGGDLNA